MIKKFRSILPMACMFSVSVVSWPYLASEESTKPVVSDLMNTAPIIYVNDMETSENIPVTMTVRIYDKEDDEVNVVVSEMPAQGEVTVSGLSVTYTPFPGSEGSDSFRLRAVDSVGNESDDGIVNVTIENNGSEYYYADMKQNPSHYSALKLWEYGIIEGQSVGSIRLFSPNTEVSRSEFLLYLLSALGVEDRVEPCVNTRLDNDTEIAAWLKPYVMMGIELGIIREDSFDANEIITRAEAVLYIDRAGKIPDVEGYDLGLSDSDDIPDWATQSYRNLGAYRMLDLYDSKADPDNALTRDTAADLIWQLYKYNQKHLVVE